jgi:putative colanic acid biosynthesis glycosyltransferase
MNEPVISIITVTKNNAAGLKLTARSIEVQQNPIRYEWIVIDGASTDTTPEILERFKDLNPVIASEPDQGIYDAMNKGIDRATGRYLWFLNAGDCIPDAYTLREIGKEIQNNLAPEFIHADARENGTIKPSHGLHAYKWGQITHHQAMLYRRSTVAELRYDTQYTISADYAFTLIMISRAVRPHHFARVICDFQSGGISQTRAELGRQENFEIRRDLLGMHPLHNKFIFTMNRMTHWLKQKMPWLYSKLRTS